MAQAVAEGTYFIAQPFHCAVGTKPEMWGEPTNHIAWQLTAAAEGWRLSG